MTVQPGLTCLNCHEVIDQQTDVLTDQPEPEPGNLALCVFCGYVACYTMVEPGSPLQLRELSNGEWNMILADPQLAAVLQARAHIMGQDPAGLAAGNA